MYAEYEDSNPVQMFMQERSHAYYNVYGHRSQEQFLLYFTDT